jgi:Predicted membrane protein
VKVKKLTTMAVMTALSIVLIALLHFPIFPAAPFLEYDPADIPILLVSFIFGPIEGLCVTVVASVLQGITVSSGSNIYGVIMHILATGTYVLTAGLIWKYGKKTPFKAAVALAFGAVAMTVMMIGANLLITPYFMKVEVKVVQGMLLPVIIPFNLIKSGVNGALTFILYMPLSKEWKRLNR